MATVQSDFSITNFREESWNEHRDFSSEQIADRTRMLATRVVGDQNDHFRSGITRGQLGRESNKGALMDLPCPNCGKIISTRATAKPLTCPDCKEELVWSAEGKKLLLSKPLPTYLDTGKEAAEIAALWERADQSEGMIDLRRRQATVEMAAKWVGERIALGNRYFKIGGGLGIICVIFLAIASIRVLVLGSIQLDAFVLFIVASLIIPFGFFFFIWSVVDRFTMVKYIKRIQEERRILQEEEKSLRN